MVQRLGAAQQGIPEEALETTVRALRGIYNGALIRLMLECEQQRLAAEQAEAALRAAREQAQAALDNTRRLAARVNLLSGTNQRLQEEAGRLRRRDDQQQRLWLPLAMLGGFALGVVARRLGISLPGSIRPSRSKEEPRQQQHEQGLQRPWPTP